MSQFQSSLEGKVGILTGGTSGFGFEIVDAVLARGASMAVFSVDSLTDEQVADVRARGKGKVKYWIRDIMADGASEDIVNLAMEEYGRVDFVIANAGFAIRFEQSLLELPESELRKAMRTQFEIFPICLATLALAAARVMAPVYENIEPDEWGHRPDSGSIVVTLSEAALNPLRDDLLAYSAAKWANWAVMRSLAATLGPKEHSCERHRARIREYGGAEEVLRQVPEYQGGYRGTLSPSSRPSFTPGPSCQRCSIC